METPYDGLLYLLTDGPGADIGDEQVEEVDEQMSEIEDEKFEVEDDQDISRENTSLESTTGGRLGRNKVTFDDRKITSYDVKYTGPLILFEQLAFSGEDLTGIVFCKHFNASVTGLESNASEMATKNYLECADSILEQGIKRCLASYNTQVAETSGGRIMNLVTFREALHHATRLSRALVRHCHNFSIRCWSSQNVYCLKGLLWFHNVIVCTSPYLPSPSPSFPSFSLFPFLFLLLPLSRLPSPPVYLFGNSQLCIFVLKATPGGHALLLSSLGYGRRSLTKVTAHAACYKVRIDLLKLHFFFFLSPRFNFHCPLLLLISLLFIVFSFFDLSTPDVSSPLFAFRNFIENKKFSCKRYLIFYAAIPIENALFF